jgi:hypothetical protein
MTLSLGGPMKEIQRDRARLVQVLRDAVDPPRVAVGGL